MIMILIAPALLVIALILIWQGARGVPRFSEPHCWRCSYDLRGLDWQSDHKICPECGSDVSRRGAVRYADYRRSTLRIVAGVAVMGLCVLGIAAERVYVAYRRQAPSVQSNARVIANLKTSAGTPWDWQELEKRYKSGKLSGNEASAAIDQLIAYLNANPRSPRGPLVWADGFFTLAMKGGHIPDQQLKRLCDAFYGSDPAARMQKRIRQNGKLRIEFRPLNSWELPGTKSVQALRSVQIDGKPLVAYPRYDKGKSRDYLSCGRHGWIGAEADVTVPPGKHEVVLELDWGLLDEKTQITPRFEDRPGQADKWPRTIVRRVLTAKMPIEVTPADVSPIKLVTDPASDPSAGGLITFASVQVIAQGKTLSLRPQYKAGQTVVPLCFRIRMKAAGQDYDLGWAGYYQGGSTSSSGGRVDSLPADARQATIILEPAPDVAEENMTVEEIWGKPIVIERVPLDRYDLEDQQDRTAGTKPARG